jgi:hypothetical protein
MKGSAVQPCPGPTNCRLQASGAGGPAAALAACIRQCVRQAGRAGWEVLRRAATPPLAAVQERAREVLGPFWGAAWTLPGGGPPALTRTVAGATL